MNYLGENGFSAVMTCLQDCLPSKIPTQYFHKLKSDYKQQSKEDSFLHTVVDVKETHSQGGKQAYQCTTLSNIDSVDFEKEIAPFDLLYNINRESP